MLPLAIQFPDISPEIFTIPVFGHEFALRWYALAYIVGIVLGWRLAVRALRTSRLWPHDTPPMTTERLDDLLTWVILGILIGGRLGFVLIYQPAYYLANPAEIPAIWQGGMSFHGGLTGVVLASWLYARRHALPYGSTADLLVLGAPPGLLLGRLANFINAELWGRPTDLPWGVIFPGTAAQDCPGVEGLCARHPSQLYEAGLEGLVLGLVLVWLAWRRGWLRRPWQIFGTFIAGYGMARFLVEFARQPDAQFTGPGNPLGYAVQIGTAGLTMGQLLSLPMILLGLWLIFRARRRPPRAKAAADRGCMTPLGRLLAQRIAATGPITVADFMAECLLHPRHGYYVTRDPFGAGGDFTTAPEISQMFGELIGLALAQAWLDRGRPAPATLAELGPGRGTLMADALRAASRVPGFAAAVRVHLIEASPALRAIQADALRGHEPTWHDDVADLPDAPLFLVANEFLDALPIRQFVRDGNAWRERVVGAGDAGLTFGLTPAAPRPELEHRRADTSDGDLVERSLPAQAVATTIAERIARSGGAAIVIDYGGWRSRGDTLQAVRSHAPVDPLETPGEADLTAHVDFEAVALAAQAAGASVTPMVAQGVLLERLGITARAQRLGGKLAGAALASHIAAHRRLTHPEEMGTLFKSIAIHDGVPPPGFIA